MITRKDIFVTWTLTVLMSFKKKNIYTPMMRGRGQTCLLIRTTLLFKLEADLSLSKYIKISNRTSHFQLR